jgi:hypothetical protein
MRLKIAKENQTLDSLLMIIGKITHKNGIIKDIEDQLGYAQFDTPDATLMDVTKLKMASLNVEVIN